MVVVDAALQGVAGVEQGAVMGGEVAHERCQAAPEGTAIDPGAGDSFLVDEALQDCRDLEAANVDALRHSVLLMFLCSREHGSVAAS
jgi:hypothetical protein